MTQYDGTSGREGVDEREAREALERERTRVTGLIGDLRSEGLDEEESDQHPADQASDTFEREKDLAILEQLESELAEIEAALARLDDGTYGVDEVSGEPIDPERLAAYPQARTNVDRSDTR